MHPTTLIAENHICISYALFKEGMHAVGNKAYKKTVRKMALILLVLYFAAAVWLWYTSGSLFFLAGESIFLLALLFWLIVMLPRTKCRSKYKSMAKIENTIPERTVKFYQNHLCVITDTGKETCLPYDTMQNWLETRNLYILNFKNNVSVLLAKNGFIAGNFHIVKSLFMG